MVSPGLYPFDSQFLSIDGLRYHYLDEGQGEPLVMVHGNPSWSIYFRHLVLALRDRFRVIVPDHIGCGLSDKPGDDRYAYRLSRRIDDLEALLDHLGIDGRVTLVLHDWGGMIGMGYAHRHPERVARIVLMNTAAFFLPSDKSFPLALRLCRTPLGALLVRGCNAFALAASYVCCKRKPMPKALRQAYRAPYDSWHNRIATLRFVQDIPLSPRDVSYATVAAIEAGLPQFAAVPMLICWGERDFVFSTHFLAEWQRRFPAAEVHRFSDGGHYILEDAAEEIVPLVQSFLERHPLAGE